MEALVLGRQEMHLRARKKLAESVLLASAIPHKSGREVRRLCDGTNITERLPDTNAT